MCSCGQAPHPLMQRPLALSGRSQAVVIVSSAHVCCSTEQQQREIRQFSSGPLYIAAQGAIYSCAPTGSLMHRSKSRLSAMQERQQLTWTSAGQPLSTSRSLSRLARATCCPSSYRTRTSCATASHTKIHTTRTLAKETRSTPTSGLQTRAADRWLGQ